MRRSVKILAIYSTIIAEEINNNGSYAKSTSRYPETESVIVLMTKNTKKYVEFIAKRYENASVLDYCN